MSSYIRELINRAHKAQQEIEFFTQEQVDDMCERIAWSTIQEEFAQALAEKGVFETRMGDVPSKYAKIRNKVRGGWQDMKGQRSTGVIEEDSARGLIKIAKPMGVIGALVPCTNCEATQILKSMFALKARNSIVLAPHPRARETNKMVIQRMREALKQGGYPEDLIIHVDEVSIENSQTLMELCDCILATGGGGLVKAAYSSGTPAYGVGAGNAVTLVDDSASLAAVADRIKRSKTFDQATSCSAENACLVQEEVYAPFRVELQKAGAHLVRAEEKIRLEKAMWVDGRLNKDLVAQRAETIASLAGIPLAEGETFFVVEEEGIGPGFPFSGEKLSVVMALYSWKSFGQAIEMVNAITAYAGAGHSCGIHTEHKDRVLDLAQRVRVSRVMVNQPQCLANSGAWTNGMPVTLTLGCGTWGGNISSENITWKHLINTTWVSSPIPNRQLPDEELFSREVRGLPQGPLSYRPR